MRCKHKILWLGSYQSEKQFEQMRARNIGQASGYTSQKGIVKGIDSILDKDSIMDTIGVISYPAYPVYPSKKVSKEEWSRTGTSVDIHIGYCDLKYITYLSRAFELQKEVKKWADENAGEEKTTVIIYEPSVAKLKAAIYLKKRYSAKIFVIIPDIPELVNLGANKIIKIGKKYAASKMREQFKSVDGFILYSSHMAEYYNLTIDKWILMEGVFDEDELQVSFEDKETHPIRLMYCGALDEFRGTPQLLDAFEQLRDKDYELWLCGAGRSDDLIRERADKDNRIHHYGYIDSREEVLKYEQMSDVLIHTRDIKSPAAPYCFPSKLFEYLVTGKPVLSVDIPGIPREYFDYMIKIEDLSVEGIKAAIVKACSISFDERKEQGEQARKFILDNKNSKIQARKILGFIWSKL